RLIPPRRSSDSLTLAFVHGPAAPVHHPLRFSLARRANQGVPLLQLILRFASASRLDLPVRTDPFGLHALSPQRDSVSIDFVVGSDFQIGISFCSGQNQPAAQGHLLRGSLSRFPTNQLRLIFCG